MMKKLPRIGLVFPCLLVVMASALGVTTYAVSDRFNVRIDGLAFEPGSSVALELVPAEGPACFDDNLMIEEVELVDASGSLIHVAAYDSFVYAFDWLGVVALRAADGSNLAPGAYEIRVVTSGGEFTAGLSVIPAGELGPRDRFVAGVSTCNLALRAYRVISESDSPGEVTLRIGDRLMVLLAGNPTTGYSWSVPVVYGYEPLQESAGVEYRQSPGGLLGAGGQFLYRYWAIDAGTQAFSFSYARPWETTGPIATLAFTVTVR